jgi:hypothetical protein
MPLHRCGSRRPRDYLNQKLKLGKQKAEMGPPDHGPRDNLNQKLKLGKQKAEMGPRDCGPRDNLNQKLKLGKQKAEMGPRDYGPRDCGDRACAGGKPAAHPLHRYITYEKRRFPTRYIPLHAVTWVRQQESTGLRTQSQWSAVRGQWSVLVQRPVLQSQRDWIIQPSVGPIQRGPTLGCREEGHNPERVAYQRLMEEI